MNISNDSSSPLGNPGEEANHEIVPNFEYVGGVDPVDGKPAISKKLAPSSAPLG